MSSTFTPPPAQPTPTDNAGSNNSGGLGGPSSSLYLYTFLVTLALLLSISASIIARSYLIRRRIRRMIADGTWVEPEERARRRTLGEKPRMYEAYVGAEKGAPLSAAFVQRNSAPPSSPPTLAPPAPRRFAFFRRSSPRVQSGDGVTQLDVIAVEAGSPIDDKPGNADKLPLSAPIGPSDVVQVAMFIAMPYPNAGALHGRGISQCGDVELPPLELGVRTTKAKGSL